MSVVQMGSLSDFELLIRVFLVLKCRCVSAGIATRPFIMLLLSYVCMLGVYLILHNNAFFCW